MMSDAPAPISLDMTRKHECRKDAVDAVEAAAVMVVEALAAM
jgi:hypothetical protein